MIIKPTNSSYLESTTNVNFTNCEKNLREILNISDSRILTFLQIEINNQIEQSLINKIEYQVYDDNKTLLDLSICNDINIQIFHLINNNSLIDIKSVSSFQALGIDIFNIHDSFFNDICNPYSIANNDVTLKDRIKDIYQNYSLCDGDCTYVEVNIENMTILCDCKVKTNININETYLNIEQFENIKKESTFGIIKCYNLVFSLNGKLKNIGFWIFFILLISHIPLLIIYYSKGIKLIQEYLIQEMTKNGYLNQNNNNNNNNNINNNLKKRKSNKYDNTKNIKKRPSNKIDNNKILDKRRKLITHSPQKRKSKMNFQNSNNANNNNDIINKKRKSKKSYILTNKLVNDISSINNIKLSDKDTINQINNNDKNLKYKRKSTIKKNSSVHEKRNSNKKIYDNKLIDSSNSILKNINDIQTQGNQIENDKKDKIINFNLININIYNKKNYTPQNSFLILNNYTFEEAIKYDMRSICLIFYIFLLSKEPIFHAFLYKSPLEIFYLRLTLLIFIISSDLALNAFFYFDDNISDKYNSKQNLFLFTFNNNVTIILLSTLISFIFTNLFIKLSNTTNTIRDIFKKEEKKLESNKKYIVTDIRKKEIFDEIINILKKYKIKVIILNIIQISFIIFFWYYVTAFCHVYINTQLSWLLDSLFSMLSRLVIIGILSLAFSKLYRMSIESNIQCIYKIVLFLYSFG